MPHRQREPAEYPEPASPTLDVRASPAMSLKTGRRRLLGIGSPAFRRVKRRSEDFRLHFGSKPDVTLRAVILVTAGGKENAVDGHASGVMIAAFHFIPRVALGWMVAVVNRFGNREAFLHQPFRHHVGSCLVFKAGHALIKVHGGPGCTAPQNLGFVTLKTSRRQSGLTRHGIPTAVFLVLPKRSHIREESYFDKGQPEPSWFSLSPELGEGPPAGPPLTHDRSTSQPSPYRRASGWLPKSSL